MDANAKRAEKAYRTVLAYEGDGSVEESVSSLLGNLRHLCDESGYDYAELDKLGYQSYLTDLAAGRREAK